MSNDEDVYFIRHKPEKNISIDWIKSLKKANKISIFWNNTLFTKVVKNTDYSGDKIEYKEEYFLKDNNTESYKSKYKSALGYMWRLGKNGGIVVAEYNNDQECLVGRVKPNTNIEVFEGKLNVTLQLQDIKILKYREYPVLLAIKPYGSTICNPRASFFKTAIPMLINDKTGPITPEAGLLHYKMLEQMCLEYLRRETEEKNILKLPKLDYCILRLGKSAAIVDIAGISDKGRSIYAQVKADKITDGDRNKFIRFVNKSNSHNMIFCKEANSVDEQNKKERVNNIVCVDIDDVFSDLWKNGYEEMLKRLINFPDAIRFTHPERLNA